MNDIRCDCEVIHQEAVEKAKETMLAPDTYEDLACLLKHFGDPTRLKILYVLRNQELCVCDLAALLNLTKSAISHQLKALKLAKLVRSRRDGQIIFYTLNDEHVQDILEIALAHISE